MSYQAIDWVLDHAKVSMDSEWRVLMVMAHHADPYGRDVWPSQEALARRSRLSVRGLRNVLCRLEASHLIERGPLQDHGRPVRWDLVMSATDRPRVGTQEVPREGRHPGSARGVGTQEVPEGRHPGSAAKQPRTILEQPTHARPHFESTIGDPWANEGQS